MINELLVELRRPFDPSVVTWKPGAMSREGNSALGMAYADVRAYQDRLDEVCGLDWEVGYMPWGDRIICHVTIAGLTRSSTGEPDAQSERSEIAGTATEAQAFKRACAMWGLGRYLYNLPSVWADYSKEQRKFTDKGLAKLEKIVADHYQKALAEAKYQGALAEAKDRPMPTMDEVRKMVDAEEDEPALAKDFEWPTEPEQLGVVAASGDSEWLTGRAKDMRNHFRTLHYEGVENSGSRLSMVSQSGGTGQYGLLVSMLDARYGAHSHRAILSLLCDDVITKDNRPAQGCRELIDWLKHPEENHSKLTFLDTMVFGFQEAWAE